MDQKQLHEQNVEFADTHGVSANNQEKGFIPAFKDIETGRVELARHDDGSVATMHLISGLPGEWAEAVDPLGKVTALKSSIVAGFCRDGDFFTREQAIRACRS